MLFSLMKWYNQKRLTGVIDAGHMYDVCAVPPSAGKTLEFVWMRRYHHYVGSHPERLAGGARNGVTRIHVGDAEPIDTLRPSGNYTLYKLKENTIETSRVVMLGAGRWTR
jgi:hypothetical protein